MGVRPGRIGLLLVGAPLLAAGIYAAAVRGLADAHYTHARLTLGESPLDKSAPRPEVIAAAHDSIREALALEPANPHFVEQSARLHELRALGLQRGDPAMREGLRESLAQYREAAAMRPGSPYVWASIAMLKARLDEIDFEFYGGLQRADNLGRWEPEIQLALADVGLATWRILPRSIKPLVLGAIERAMRRQEVELRRVAARHGSLERVCADELTLRDKPTGLCVKK